MSDHIPDTNKMRCPHCGMPADREQNGIQGYLCGSSFCKTFNVQWARSMTCLEIENQSMKDAIKFFEDLSMSEGRRLLDASTTAKTTMSETPITMEEVAKFGRVDIEFAIQLERKLNSSNEHIKRLEEAGDAMAEFMGRDDLVYTKDFCKQLADKWTAAKEDKP